MRLKAGLCALLIWVTAVQANAPYTSLRPVAREDVFPVALPSFAPDRSLRPVIRPESARVLKARVTPQPERSLNGTSSRVGRVCGDRKIRGLEIGNVPGKLQGCGIRNAVKVYEVAGVSLSTPASMSCDTAKTLKGWVEGGMARAVRPMRSDVEELKIVAGYSCRTRNHKPGAKISEHGKGKAIDIAEFRFENGEVISLLDHWGQGRKGRVLRDLHRSACGPFGTVLGPESDRHHRDHFHFDTANHRGSSYCR